MKDVFLSHTGADKDWVEGLANRLESEVVDGRPLAVWFDKWDSDYGENILEKIEDGLKTSRFVAVVLSPAFTRASWPKLEWQTQVYDDPTGKRGRILPIMLHKYDPSNGEPLEIPLPLRLLKWFDFTDPKRADDAYGALVRRIRGEKPQRGRERRSGSPPGAVVGQETPDEVEEAIVGNLLPVSRMPVWIYSDLTSVRKKTEVWRALSGTVPPFSLHGGRLYSFFSPEDPKNPFSRFLTGTKPARERPSEWIGDAEREKLLVHLLNDAFREHCYRLRIRTPKQAAREKSSDRFQYFFPTFDGKSRAFAWGVPGMQNRTLAKVVPQGDGSSLGVHYAARIRFIVLGEDVYLLVQPGWMFTSDGVTPIDGKRMGVLSTKWGGKERNGTVLRHVLMWGQVLSGGGALVEVECGGGQVLALESVPSHARTMVGLTGDTLRLDRILGGEGAGELQIGDDELDAAADIRTNGAFAGGSGDEYGEGPDPEDEIGDDWTDEGAPEQRGLSL